MPQILRVFAPDGPHASVPGLVTEAQAVPELWARSIGFTYYPRMRLLVTDVDRPLTPAELAQFDALLEAHAGEEAI